LWLEFKQYKQTYVDILNRVKEASNKAQRNELLSGPGASPEEDSTEDRYIAEGENILDDNQRILQETLARVGQAREIGMSTQDKLHQQNQTLMKIGDDLDQMESSLDVSKKVLRQMGLKLVTDKYIWILLLLVCAAIVCIFIVLKLWGMLLFLLLIFHWLIFFCVRQSISPTTLLCYYYYCSLTPFLSPTPSPPRSNFILQSKSKPINIPPHSHLQTRSLLFSLALFALFVYNYSFYSSFHSLLTTPIEAHFLSTRWFCPPPSPDSSFISPTSPAIASLSP